MVPVPNKNSYRHRFALKNLGCKWDKTNKAWLAPESVAAEAFRLVGAEYKPAETPSVPAPAPAPQASTATAALNIIGDAPELEAILPKLAGRTETLSLALFSSPENLADHVAALVTDDARDWTGYVFANNGHIPGGLEKARHGWQEGAERVARMRDKINLSHPTAKRLARYSVAGAVPSVPRAVAGNPMHMKTHTSADTKRRPVVTLVVNMSGNCNIPDHVFTNRAGVAAAIIDMIEATGYSVHLIAAAPSAREGFRQCVAVTVKEPNQPVDLPRLAFAVGHPEMFRGLVFATVAGNRFNEPLGRSMGYAIDFDTATAAQTSTYVLPSVHATQHVFASEESAETEGLQHALKALAEQGCPGF